MGAAIQREGDETRKERGLINESPNRYWLFLLLLLGSRCWLIFATHSPSSVYVHRHRESTYYLYTVRLPVKIASKLYSGKTSFVERALRSFFDSSCLGLLLDENYASCVGRRISSFNRIRNQLSTKMFSILEIPKGSPGTLNEKRKSQKNKQRREGVFLKRQDGKVRRDPDMDVISLVRVVKKGKTPNHGLT